MDNLADLSAFVHVADSGSFVGAANRLGMTASAVGKCVGRLERSLGVRLFQRSTRRMRLTDEGQLLLVRARTILAEAAAARLDLSLAAGGPSGLLRIGAPRVASHFLLPLLAPFTERYPAIELDIRFTDQRLHLIEHHLDMVIRSGPLPDTRTATRPLQRFQLQLWASRGYAAVHGLPDALEDLARHRAVRFRHPDTGQLLPWPTPTGDLPVPWHPRTVMSFDHVDGVLGACLNGAGIACMPDFLVGPTALERDLVTVLPHQVHRGGRFHALWLPAVAMLPRLRVWLDHLAAGLCEQPACEPSGLPRMH